MNKTSSRSTAQATFALSPSQHAVLAAAAKHPQGWAIWFPETLKGGARTKVLQALIQSGSLEKVKGSDSPRITQAGYQALGIKAPQPRNPEAHPPKTSTHKAVPAKATKAKASAPRQDSKQAQVIEMLKRPQGASIKQVMQATEWQQHTVRGFFAGALKKKLGLPITSDKADGAERVYRISPDAASTTNDATGAQ